VGKPARAWARDGLRRVVSVELTGQLDGVPDHNLRRYAFFAGLAARRTVCTPASFFSLTPACASGDDPKGSRVES